MKITATGRYQWSPFNRRWEPNKNTLYPHNIGDTKILDVIFPNEAGESVWWNIDHIASMIPPDHWFRLSGNGGYTFTKGHGLRRDFLFEKTYGARGSITAVRAVGLV